MSDQAAPQINYATGEVLDVTIPGGTCGMNGHLIAVQQPWNVAHYRIRGVACWVCVGTWHSDASG